MKRFKIIVFLVIVQFVTLTVAAQERQRAIISFGPGDCSHVTWNAQCSLVGDCVYHSSPGAGCNLFGGCNNCYRGLVQPIDRSVKELAFDSTTQFTGSFIRGRFVVAEPGPLAKIGVSRGMVLSKINYWKVTAKRLQNLIYRKHAALRIEFYQPGSRRKISSTLTP